MNLNELPGAQRAAAFLLSLDDIKRTELLKHIDTESVHTIVASMMDLHPDVCTRESIDSLFQELAKDAFGGSPVAGSDDKALQTMLEKSFGQDSAAMMLSEIHEGQRRANPFGFIEGYSPDVVFRVMREESNGVVALVLASTSPSFSAEILSLLDPEPALAIVKQMTDLNPPAVELMIEIADDLKLRLDEASSGPTVRDRGESLRTIADLLTFSQPETEKAVLEGLEEDDEDGSVKMIREFMFTWTDLAEVDKRAMQKILASVDTRTLSMSLKACTEEVEQNIMNNLSSRVREMVADERELAGAVPFTEVVAARNEILNAVRGLMENGEFAPARAGEELVT